MYDVQIFQRGGWGTDMVTGSRRRAVNRAREVLNKGIVPARVLDSSGREVGIR